MRPPRARTWDRRGQTPVVRVRGRSRRRISVAAMCCYRPGERSRLIYRPRFHSLLKGARKSFAWQDYHDLLVRAHLQLGAPIIVVWTISTLIAPLACVTTPQATTGSRSSSSPPTART